ncbi:MAG: DUF1292 domain-containing protein [Acholeplasmataceae bacterium]|jgi:uncharacterized protein YrzB (UPF0473 family)|nr:DUF1292 domain-containing protein [Acholeplasmataceae bacterium]
MKEDQFVVINDLGEEIVCNILFTHESEDGRNFVVFEFSDTHELSAAIYVEDPNNPGEGTLEDVTNDDDWEMLDELMAHYYEDEEELHL